MTIRLIILFIVTISVDSFSQTEQSIIDSVNAIVHKHELHSEMNTKISLNGDSIIISNVSSQKIVFSLDDISTIEYILPYNKQTVRFYCKNDNKLISSSFDKTKWNYTSIILKDKPSCNRLIKHFLSLIDVKGIILTKKSNLFQSDLAVIPFQNKYKGKPDSTLNYGVWGVDTVITGEIILKYPNGNKRLQFYLKEGIYDGKQITWFENGQIEYIEVYDNGYKNGEFITYWENGQLATKEIYELGKSNGVSEQWSQSGIKTLEEHFKNGMLILTKEWDEAGNLINEFKY